MSSLLSTGHDEIRIRASVHIGEVTIVDDDMYGVMINYTSRLLKAAAGGIIVSDKAMQNVRGTNRELRVKLTEAENKKPQPISK